MGDPQEEVENKTATEATEPEDTPISSESSQIQFDRLALYRMIEAKRTELAEVKALYYLARAGIPGINDHPNTIRNKVRDVRRCLDVLVAMVTDVQTRNEAVPEPLLDVAG